MRIYPLSEIIPRDIKVEWVWGNRIPRGYVTLLGAKGGTGKSGFALWLANELAEEGKRVLYVDAEHTLKHICERARDWKLAGVDRIGIIAHEDEDEPNEEKRVLESWFPGFAKTTVFAKEFEPELIVFDSLTAISANRNLKEEKEAVMLMKELRELALGVNGAVLTLCHTKKDIQNDDFIVSVDDIVGSHAIVDLSRSVLLMTQDKQNPRIKSIRHGKCNFSAPAPDLVFTLDKDGVADMREVNPVNVIHIEQGTKMEIYYTVGLQAAKEGKTKKEIRSCTKAAGASETEASRVVAWLNKQGFAIDKTIPVT